MHLTHYLWYLRSSLPYRGETFRVAFSQLGTLRSVLPQKVNVMALTATATTKTRKIICRTLGMDNPVYVVDIPDRPNIK